MGPDPFNMPGAGGASNSQQLGQAVGEMAPMASQWHGAITGSAIPQVAPTPTQQPQGNLAKFGHFLGGALTEIGHVTGGVAHWVGQQATDFATSIPRFGIGEWRKYNDTTEMNAISQQSDQLSGQVENLHQQYKSGQITQDQYKQGITNLSKGLNYLSARGSEVSSRVGTDVQQVNKAGIDAEATLLTLLTGGLGKAVTLGERAGVAISAGEKTAAGFLSSSEADVHLADVEKGIANVAQNKGIFEKLTSTAKVAFQKSVGEVVASNTGSMTAKQIARATAVNMMFKYPIYYNMMSSTGQQVYNELQNKKYGDAVNTTAFNAALLLSGGPIGKALKWGGKALGLASASVFGRTAFWDELSKYYGDGNSAGFRNAANDMTKNMGTTERNEFIKNLSAVEETNISAVGGEAGAAAAKAARRVAGGMMSAYGFDLSQMTHQQGIEDMVNWVKAQRIADNVATANKMGPIGVGRVDIQSVNRISSVLSSYAGDEAGGLKAWEDLKSSYPNSAWANNANFDRQIEGLIKNTNSPAELDKAIRSINALPAASGFPKTILKEMASMGYIPITPNNLEAPFKEGTGVLKSRFAGEGDVFSHAVTPLPVLGFVGSMLTSAGLSPNASVQRVYQVFTDNLGKNLEASGFLTKVLGEDLSTTTDKLLKDLSDYAHNPQGKGVFGKVPIQDFRMMTTSDIATALNVSKSDAALVQKAIASSFLQVPLAVRGLGDRLVDTTYKFGASAFTARRYMKIQGALRYSWNPFFQYLRVIPKTEFLSEVSGGGVLNSLFAGRLKEIGDIRDTLRASGFFSEPGNIGTALGGEAIDLGGATGRNLAKKLLPMQERSISGLIDSQAQKVGMNWKDYIQAYPQNVRDTIQTIAEYDRNANFLNSPLMRTLNIAFFPIRFETKVATIMAQNLAKTSLLTQVSVIKGLMQAHQWLNSDEGKAWYSQNADAIGIFKYVSPLASLNEIFQSLVPGHDHSLGNFGELGGLPFGWIPQLLDAEGLTHFNQPGVDAKTGKTIPTYIPVTDKGQAAIAIQDLLGSLFSYPGATIGLPSKASITRGAALGLTGASKKTDLRLVTPTNLSQQQQNYADTISSLSNSKVASPQPLPEPALRQATSVTPREPNFPQKPVKAKTKSTKLKKSSFRPALLPGQSTLGQL